MIVWNSGYHPPWFLTCLIHFKAHLYEFGENVGGGAKLNFPRIRITTEEENGFTLWHPYLLFPLFSRSWFEKSQFWGIQFTGAAISLRAGVSECSVYCGPPFTALKTIVTLARVSGVRRGREEKRAQNPLSLPFRTPVTQAISEFTQQDGRKKRTAKRFCVTNVTGLLLMCFVVIFT